MGVVNFDLALQNWEVFAKGVWMTLHLTFLSLLIGGCIAIPTAFAMLRGGVAGWFAGGYVYLFRGTPLLVQTYLIYYGVSQFDFIRDTWLWRPPAQLRAACVQDLMGWKVCISDFIPSLRSAWWCALIAFSLNSGAYVAEILRGALKNTPKGELEGAKSLGLSDKQVRRLIHMPSAFRRALPQYGNEVIFMLHGGAIMSVITLQDILGVGRWLRSKYYVPYEGLLASAILYLCITYTLIFLFQMIERRYLRHLSIGTPGTKRGWFGRSSPVPAR